MSDKAAILVRVSDARLQTNENQLQALSSWGERRGFDVVKTYEIEGSAYKGEHLMVLNEVYEDARLRLFNHLLVWSLDRLSREGPEAILGIVHRFGRSGVKVLSLQEPWTETSGEMQDLLLSIAGWAAQMESARRSERVKAGMARAKSEGKAVGRPKGSKDGKKRSRRGYLLRYAD